MKSFTNSILSFSLVPSVKVTDLDYAINYGYLNQVIPPTQDAIEEYSLCPLDTSKWLVWLILVDCGIKSLKGLNGIDRENPKS